MQQEINALIACAQFQRKGKYVLLSAESVCLLSPTTVSQDGCKSQHAKEASTEVLRVQICILYQGLRKGLGHAIVRLPGLAFTIVRP